MSEEMMTAVKLVVGLLTIISIAYGFYKIIIDRARIEADLRNEIKNIKDDQTDMCKLIEKMTTRFDVISIRVGDIDRVSSDVKNHDRTMERLGDKLDDMSNKLTEIKISLERKSDRQ